MRSINNIKWILKSIINHHYIGFLLYRFLFLRKKNNVVNKDTDLLIEGYPRSGNTFCFVKCQLLNSKLKIASHRHELGHILYALKIKVPVIFVFRNPIDSIASFIIRERVSIIFAINYYIFLHKRILRYNSVVLLSFNNLILNKDLLFSNNEEIIFRRITKNEELEIKKIILKMEKLDSGENEVRATHLAFPNKNMQKNKDRIKAIIRNKYPRLLKDSESIYNKLLINAHTSTT